MATRPLWNGTARVVVDNGVDDPALQIRYGAVVQTDTGPVMGTWPEGTIPPIANRSFEVQAGVAVTLFWAARRYGSGTGGGANDPQVLILRIFNDDDNNDALTGAVFDSGNVSPGGVSTATPRSGSVTWTPATTGTFRLQIELRRSAIVNAPDFGPTSSDWRLLSDGLHQFGGASLMTRAVERDKGRFRSGAVLSSLAVTERGSVAPATFAYTGLEAVRIDATLAAATNKTTATETFRIRQRRTGTSTIDLDAASTSASGTVQRSETVVTDTTYPAVAVTYDTVAAITTNSSLHTNNTRQYDALGGRAASGVWAHFLSVGGGLVLVDYLTVERITSHTVDPRITAGHHFQRDDNAFGLAKHDASFQMLSTESGFIWTIFRNARAEGVNGLTVVQTLVPVKPGDTFTGTATTATTDSQAGVSGRLDWTASKPGGTWNKTVDVTAPTAIDDNAYLLSATRVHTLLSPDPNIIGWPYLSVGGTVEADHAHAGDALTVVLTISHIARRLRITNATEVSCALVRYNATLSRYEFLASDDTTWAEWTTTATIAAHTLTETGTGTGIYTHTFNTTGWGDMDILGVSCNWKVDGTPYEAVSDRELVGRAHSHASAGGAVVTAQTTISP